MAFIKDLKLGQGAERKVKEAFIKAGRDVEPAIDRSYDFLSKGEKIEVKRDFMEARTKNVAIETWNHKQNKPSGPHDVDYVVYVFSDEIRICSAQQLKELMAIKPKRVVEKAGDGNATICLYGRDVFNQYSQSLENFLND